MTNDELLADLTAYVERRFPVGGPTVTRLCATGEPVLTLTSGGIKVEGDMHAILCASPEIAAGYFRQQFDKYAAGKDGALYWRCKPMLHEAAFPDPFSGLMTRLYAIVARLIISSKKVAQ